MKEFKWCPKEGIKTCAIQIPHSHVCIRSIGAPITVPECGNQALYLTFHDLEPKKIRATNAYAKDKTKGEEIINGCFTEEQAELIVEFVKRCADELIMVNCEAGISRSPAVVLALRAYYGGDTSEVFHKACPNSHVNEVMIKVLNRKTKPDDQINPEIFVKLWNRFVFLLSVESFGEKAVITENKKQTNFFGSVDSHRKVFERAVKEISEDASSI
jgi:predicted protein tyrosine phosphatase